jgi:hypothetical protein
MSSMYLRLTLAATCVALALCAAVFMFVLVGRERQRVLCGECPTYECLVQALDGSDAIEKAAAIEQVPATAHNITYFAFVHLGMYQVTFDATEDEFLSWTSSLGWQNPRPRKGLSAAFLLYDVVQPRSAAQLIDFEKGYSLSSQAPDGMLCRNICYDQDRAKAYLEVWLPLPSGVRND